MIMRNKRGAMGLAIIVAITILIFGMITLNLVKPVITTARSSAELDCANSSISDGTKLTCLAVDWVIPYLIIITFSVGGGVIANKINL